MAHPERTQKQERFILVYVFCYTADAIPEKLNSSEWCRFGLVHKDEIGVVSATAFATMYGMETNQLWRQNKPTGDIARECRSLLGGDFSTKIEMNTSQLYPKLFAKIREAKFLTGTVLVEDASRYTLYQLDRKSIQVIAEKKAA